MLGKKPCRGSLPRRIVPLSLGLIVTELVIDAFKHAFPSSVAKGRIVVTGIGKPVRCGWRAQA